MLSIGSYGTQVVQNKKVQEASSTQSCSQAMHAAFKQASLLPAGIIGEAGEYKLSDLRLL